MQHLLAGARASAGLKALKLYPVGFVLETGTTKDQM